MITNEAWIMRNTKRKYAFPEAENPSNEWESKHKKSRLNYSRMSLSGLLDIKIDSSDSDWELSDFVRALTQHCKNLSPKHTDYSTIQQLLTDSANFYLVNSKLIFSKHKQSQWVHLANQFSNGTSDACKQVCVDITMQCKFSLFGLYALKYLGLLANACSHWPEDRGAELAIERIAKFINDSKDLDTLLDDGNSQELALIANACSKWKKNNDCERTVALIGEYVADQHIDKYNWRELSNLANALSKWPKNEGCQEGLFHIADFIADVKSLELSPIPHSNLTNACSKFPENKDCETAVARMARRVDNKLRQYENLHLVNLSNGFSRFPVNEDCKTATLIILKEVIKRNLFDFNDRNIATLVNAWSRWPKNKECEDAVKQVAKWIKQKKDLSQFTYSELANLANAFSQWVEDPIYQEAICKIAKTSKLKNLSEMSRVQRSMLANAFSKWPKNKNCKAFIINEAKQESKNEYSEKDFSCLANAYSKYPKNKKCKTATKKIARQWIRADLSKYLYESLISLAGAFSKWSDDPDCRAGLQYAAVDFCKRNVSLLDDFACVNMANACSKWPENSDCESGMRMINQQITHKKLSNFTARRLSLLANACSKWPHDDLCKNTMKKIVRKFSNQEFSKADNRSLVMMANACSKWPNDDDFKPIIKKIAQKISTNNLTDVNKRGFVLIANACSKWQDEPDCKEAVVNIADKIAQKDLSDFNSLNLINLANAFSKWPDSKLCAAATRKITGYFIKFDPDSLNVRDLSEAANAFSKWPMDDECKKTTIYISRTFITAAFGDFKNFQLAQLIGAFAIWSKEEDCKKAILYIARGVGRNGLVDWQFQDLSILANAAGKYPGEKDARRIVLAIAKHFENMDIADCHSPQYGILANAFSKWRQDPDCEKAITHIARRIAQLDVADFCHQETGLLINAFHKWPNNAACKVAVEHIAKKMAQEDLSQLPTQSIAMLASCTEWSDSIHCIAMMQNVAGYLAKTPDLSHLAAPLKARHLSRLNNAFGHFYQWGDEFDSLVYIQAMSAISQYIQKNHPTLKGWGILSINQLLRGFARAEMLDDIDALAPACLKLFTQQVKDEKGMSMIDLTSLGGLCMASIPLLSSIHLCYYRSQTIQLLLDLKPIIEKKLEVFNQSSPEDYPFDIDYIFHLLFLYQIIKAYTIISRQKPDMRLHLDPWIKELHLQIRKVSPHNNFSINFESNITKYSQNLLMDLEIEDVPDSLDRAIERHQDTISRSGIPATFNVDEVFGELSQHTPFSPSDQTGLYAISQCDVQGRLIQSGKLSYSILNHLTQNTVHPIWVKLPPRVDSRLLARTLIYQGREYRFDLFGGSRMKADRPKITETREAKNGIEVRNHGQLLGIPLVDTLSGTDFESLIGRLFPFKESFYYFQRAMLSAPLDLPGLKPHDHVLTGQFNIAILPDRKPGETHSFRIRDQGNAIQLRPHDGAGFIRESLLQKMGWYHITTSPGRLSEPFGGHHPRANLPADALQHYPASDIVGEEFIEKLRQKDSKEQGELWRDITTAGAKGHMGIAIPSADHRLYLPTCKMKTPEPVLLGRAPYDKPNLRPIEQKRVITTQGKDPTALFLDTCWGVQYTLVAQHQLLQDHNNKAALFFAKGILVVLKDCLWPTEFEDQDIILSAEDPKTDSTWTLRKQRLEKDTRLKAPGILSLTNVYSPGSLIAVPMEEQQKLDGDFDGDPDLVLYGYGHFFKHVQQYDRQLSQQNLTGSLKPKKTHTPAFRMSENNRYQFGRSGQILATHSLVLENFIVLQRTFLAQPTETQQKLAEAICFEIFEGVEPGTQEALTELLVPFSPSLEAVSELKREITLQVKDPTLHPVMVFLLNNLLQVFTSISEYKHETTVFDHCLLGISTLHAGLLTTLRPGWQKQREKVGKNLRAHLQLLLNQIPLRFLSKTDPVYRRSDPVQTVKNLLSLGIKIGTDSFKSNTGVEIYQKIMDQIKQVLRTQSIQLGVYYSKKVARLLSAGKFNADVAKQSLIHNPTLAATIMSKAIDELVKQKRLPMLPERPKISMAGRRMLLHSLPGSKRKHSADMNSSSTLTREPKKVLYFV
jgi:hypothetical protein